MKVLGVIPARAGSKSIPRKNLQEVGGRPLITYVLEAAREARSLDRVIVSTDSEEIAQVALAWGVEVPFLRPPELARDEVSLIPVVRHAMEFFDALGDPPQVVASIQPTNPFLTAADIDRAVSLLEVTGCESVVTVTEIRQGHPFRAMRLEGDRVFPLTEYTSDRYLQKQDRPPAYRFTGGLYVRRRHLLEQWNGRDFALGEAVRGIVLEPERAIDVDHPLDLLLVRALMELRLQKETQHA